MYMYMHMYMYMYSVEQEAPTRNSRGDVCAFYNERKCQGDFFFFRLPSAPPPLPRPFKALMFPCMLT